MDVAEVRKVVLDTIARAKQRAADRRARADASAQAFDSLLTHVVAPLMRQVANVLRVENYAFSVSTPSGSVRLASDKNADDFIEISLDTTGDAPRVSGRTSWRPGRQVVDREQVVGPGTPQAITESDVFSFLMKELEPFVER